MAATSGEYALLCLENPLLDIQAKADSSLLSKYDLKANDAILAEEKHMGLYEELLNKYEAKLIAGGAAQNTARGAQYILPPASVLYIGCVGRDKYAEILREAVAKAELRVEYRVDEEHPTGRCGVVITGHDRSICTDLAAANHYKLDHLLQPEIWALVEKASVYYVGGYHLTVCPPAAMALAEEAAKEDKRNSTERKLTKDGQIFALSLSAPFIPAFFKDPLDATAPYWDYVIGNETEARSYADSHDLKTDDIKTIAEHLAKLPKKNTKRQRVVVVTQGTEATVVATGGERVTVKEYAVKTIPAAEIDDTNGAGDAFAGGFLAGIIQGKDLDTAVEMGHWLAGLSIRCLGPSYPFPKQTFSSA